jgi:GPH family glycoside/pentoside/hexuronide:cation symporter
MYFLKPDQLVLIFVLYGFVQLFVQMGAPILFAMTADTVEYGELKTGRRVTGLVFSGALFALKLGIALGGAMLAWVLAYYGYESGDAVKTQSPQAIQGIVLATTLVPALGHALLIPIVAFYKLTTKRCAEILVALDERRGQQQS